MLYGAIWNTFSFRHLRIHKLRTIISYNPTRIKGLAVTRYNYQFELALPDDLIF